MQDAINNWKTMTSPPSCHRPLTCRTEDSVPEWRVRDARCADLAALYAAVETLSFNSRPKRVANLRSKLGSQVRHATAAATGPTHIFLTSSRTTVRIDSTLPHVPAGGAGAATEARSAPPSPLNGRDFRLTIVQPRKVLPGMSIRRGLVRRLIGTQQGEANAISCHRHDGSDLGCAAR